MRTQRQQGFLFPYPVVTHRFEKGQRRQKNVQWNIWTRSRSHFLCHIPFFWKVFCPVLVFVLQRGRELEGCRKCNKATQPCDGHHYTTSANSYCPKHPPTIVEPRNRSHSFNTKRSTNHQLAQLLCLQQTCTHRHEKNTANWTFTSASELNFFLNF